MIIIAISKVQNEPTKLPSYNWFSCNSQKIWKKISFEISKLPGSVCYILYYLLVMEIIACTMAEHTIVFFFILLFKDDKQTIRGNNAARLQETSENKHQNMLYVIIVKQKRRLGFWNAFRWTNYVIILNDAVRLAQTVEDWTCNPRLYSLLLLLDDLSWAFLNSHSSHL